jgi:hypothetical protein
MRSLVTSATTAAFLARGFATFFSFTSVSLVAISFLLQITSYLLWS